MVRGEPVEEYTAVRVEGTLQCERSVRIAPRVRSVHGSPMPGALAVRYWSAACPASTAACRLPTGGRVSATKALRKRALDGATSIGQTR